MKTVTKTKQPANKRVSDARRREPTSRIGSGLKAAKRSSTSKASMSDVGKGRLRSQPDGPRATTKAEAIVQILSQDEGASLNDLMAVTGWRAHSVRGFLSGTIRKKLGLNLTSERKGDERRYRILEGRG